MQLIGGEYLDEATFIANRLLLSAIGETYIMTDRNAAKLT